MSEEEGRAEAVIAWMKEYDEHDEVAPLTEAGYRRRAADLLDRLEGERVAGRGTRELAEADRDLRPWRYYRFDRDRLMEWLDKYAERFGPLSRTHQTPEEGEGE